MSATRQVRYRPRLRRLTKQEIAELEARNRLVLEHLAWAWELAASAARRLPTWFLVDDLLGPAEIGLIQAAERYDASTGVPFRAYARARVSGAIADSIRRREYQERAHCSLDARGDEGPRVEEMPSQEASAEALLVGAEEHPVWEQVRGLPRQHRRVIERVYRDGVSLAEVAGRSRIGQSRVSQVHREALVMLREMVGA